MKEHKEQILERMKSAGYTILNEYDDKPGDHFPEHNHPGEQLIVILRGSIEVNMAGKQYVLREGDELVFPAGAMHDATVGPEGCLYLDGEKPKD